MAVGDVAAPGGRGVGAVGGEEPDVAPVAVRRHPAAEGGDGLAIGQPRRREEDRLGAARDPRPAAGLDVDDDDVRAVVEVVVPCNLGRERDPRPVGRPGRILVRSGAVGQPARLAGRDVDDPDVGDGVVDELGAVEHVLEPIDVAVVGLGRVRRFPLGVEAACLAVLFPCRYRVSSS